MNKLLVILISLFILASSCQIPEPRDVTPPYMQIIYPNEGAVISGDFDIIINAYDDNEVQKVWCYVNGLNIGETTSIPYSVRFEIEGREKKANYVVQAMAIDGTGNTGNSEQINFTIADSPDIIPPVVEILNPQSGQTVENSVRILTNPRDNIGIQKVAFFIDGDSVDVTYTYPYAYTWETTGYSDSTQHTITAKAFDTGGNTAYSPVAVVTVYPRSNPVDIIPPTVLFLSPIDGSIVSGNVNVSVDLQDNSPITKAEFYVDGILTTSKDNPDIPWVFSWTTTADNEAHTLYIKAYDQSANIGASLITVTTQ